MTSSFKNLTINDTGYLQLPSGSSAQRSNYIVQTFTTVGTTTWTAPNDVTSVEVLVIAGGGGGGRDRGGAGGAGGLVYNNAFAVSSGTGYTVTVGAGGLGGLQSTNTNNYGLSGSNSVFGSLTAIGGGGGGDGTSVPGGNGGSGGGGGNSTPGNVSGAPGSSTQNSSGSTGFGNAGGAGVYSGPGYGAGGGGGAGSAGIAGTSTYSGNGGLGQAYSITGVSQYYAGGGGAGFYGASSYGGTYNGVGGSGVGGNGGTSYGPAATNGAANTGSGGGSCGYVGSGSYATTGGNGGSGIVVIRYKQVVKFTSTGSTTWTVPAGVNQVEVLVVGAGGAGGAGIASQGDGGGGGGGGVVYNPYFNVTPGAVLNVTVGAGGTSTTSSSTSGGYSLFGTSTNQLTNGTFSSATGWTAGTGITINTGSNNVTYASPAHGTNLSRSDISFVAGRTYTLQFTISSYTSGSLTLYYNYSGTPVLATSQTNAGNANGTYYYSFVATTSGSGFTFQANSNTYGAAVFTLSNAIIYDSTNTIQAIGGGYGGFNYAGGLTAGGFLGGSSGGTVNNNSPYVPGASGAGQGNTGGIGGSAPYYPAGGGGGAASPGGYGIGSIGGAGGAGVANNITGVTTYYGGGGGGSVVNSGTSGLGGVGGGGDGGVNSGAPTSGRANTGGGGGGAGNNPSATAGGAGGSGIVIISYNNVTSTLTQRPGMVRLNTGSTYLQNGIDSFKHAQSTSVAGLTWTAPDGLVCALDAGNTQSYPGSGNIWYDISGNNRHWTINPSYAVWNSAGQQSYFNFDGSSALRTYQNSSAAYPFYDSPLVGPASDKMGFNGSQEHTCITVTRVTAASNNFFFSFALTPQSGAGDFTSRWTTHMYYGGGSFYYDYPGCCGGQNRIFKSVQDASWVGNLKIGTWRCRRTAFPQRQFFRNNAVEADSGNENTGTAIWNRSDAAILGSAYNGRIYYIAFYNRALTDAELATQWTYLQARFGIT